MLPSRAYRELISWRRRFVGCTPFSGVNLLTLSFLYRKAGCVPSMRKTLTIESKRETKVAISRHLYRCYFLMDL